MKIAVSSTGPDLDAQVDPRFGRAQYLLIVDIDSLEFEAVQNPNVAAGGGAGIQTAQMIAGKGAEAVVTGNCGPNAYQTLAAAGIGVHVGAAGTVRESVERFKRGEFQATIGPSVPGHFGTGGAGPGMGGGTGRGRGMGGGRAGAMGAWPATAGPTPSPSESPREDLEALKQQADSMRERLEEITERIDRLSK